MGIQGNRPGAFRGLHPRRRRSLDVLDPRALLRGLADLDTGELVHPVVPTGVTALSANLALSSAGASTFDDLTRTTGGTLSRRPR